MSKYIKPTITLAATGASSGAASSCSSSTVDAKEIMSILVSMGYDPDKAFSAYDPCTEEVMFEDYCKFTSSVQIFYS